MALELVFVCPRKLGKLFGGLRSCPLGKLLDGYCDWVLDDASINSVVFDRDHRPFPGSTVEIEYHLMPDCES